MNSEIQLRKINRFLKGKGRKEIDAFCIYQWIDRCHFEGWWDAAVALGSCIPPNALNQDYQKRIEFLLGQCRNQINQRKGNFVGPIPKVFIDSLEELGLTLEGRGQNRIKLKYRDKRLLFLEKMTFEACTFYFTDRSCDSLLTWLDKNGFDYLADDMRMTKQAADERRPRMRISWDDATSILPVLFTREYLVEIEKALGEKDQESSASSKWNRLGHRIGSQAAKIDDLLLEGASLASIAVAISSTIGRVKGHIRHLENEKGIPVIKKGSIYKIQPENIPAAVGKTNRPSNIRELRLNFWSAFKTFVLENHSKLNIRKVYPEHWLDIYFGHLRCHICMTINIRRNLMTCELYIPDSKNLYRKLFDNRGVIEQELGESLQWNELPGKKASRIKLIRDADVTNPENWDEYFTWLKEKAEDIQQIFLRYV
jgi:hypothetical protein